MTKLEITCLKCSKRAYLNLIPDGHRFVAECPCGARHWVNALPSRNGSAYGVVGLI